jgi:hypothetical protein
MDWTTVVQTLAGTGRFFSSLCTETSSGDHPDSYPMGATGPSPGGKVQPVSDNEQSPPSSAEVKAE